MRKQFNHSLIFAFGGSVYCLLETLYRGRTHWSMALAGGAAMLAFFRIAAERCALWRRALRCAAAVTALEFAIGCIVNRWLHLGIWDYSDRPLNLLGQICPQFSAVWLLLSLPGMWLGSLMRKKMEW